MWSILFSRRMLVTLLCGFSSGLPLMLTGSTLQAWMKESGVDLQTIGIFSLVGLPYTVKFLWSPLLDRYALGRLGRRRSWMLATQVALATVILVLGLQNPASNPWLVALLSVCLTFFSATQDIALDAYRRESLSDAELGLGSALFINGYRLAMLASGAGALILADLMPWNFVYAVMAGLMGLGILATLLAQEGNSEAIAPKSMRDAVLLPIQDYFRRDRAVLILVFIVLYKLGDTIASAMTTPFILELGFTKTEYAAIGKSVGLICTMLGAFLGGLFLVRAGIFRSLWIFGVFQAVSTAAFSYLAFSGHHLMTLTWVIGFENLTGGMGTAAYMAFMASLTNRQFTATQYALLSSLMGIPRVFAAAPSGYLAAGLGWTNYFIACALLAIPGMLLLIWVAPWNGEKEPSVTGRTA